MKLFFAPGACSLAAHILVEETALPCTLVKVDLASHKTEHGDDYTKINPKGYVPALQLDSGDLLTEVGVVLQYLSDQKKDLHLMAAAGTLERYHQMEWLNFIATEIHKQFSPFFRPDTPAQTKEQHTKLLGRLFSFLSDHLTKQPYLAGQSFTAPDAYLSTVLGWSDHVKIDLGPWPRITDYLARVRARPAVLKALKSEGLIK